MTRAHHRGTEITEEGTITRTHHRDTEITEEGRLRLPPDETRRTVGHVPSSASPEGCTPTSLCPLCLCGQPCDPRAVGTTEALPTTEA